MEKKTFTTAVSLSHKQAVAAIRSTYTVHYGMNGDETSKSEDCHRIYSDLLLELLTLPIGSQVEVTTAYKTQGVGFTSFEFKSSKGIMQKMTIYRDETCTPKDIAYIFLHARHFGKLKIEWNTRLGQFWYTPESVSLDQHTDGKYAIAV